jgi:hypothetical protein
VVFGVVNRVLIETNSDFSDEPVASIFIVNFLCFHFTPYSIVKYAASKALHSY